MSTKILPIRKHIHDCLKNFPWTSDTQFEVIWTYVDHQLAGRGRGRQALLRAGMTDFSDRILEYQLRQANYYLKLLNEEVQTRSINIDRRRIHQLSLDDTMNQRFGKNVYGAAHQYNHSQGNVCHGQTLVDLVRSTDHVLGVKFQPYLPKKYLQRANGSLNGFETKIEQAYQLLKKEIWQLRYLGLSPTKIWTSIDCWYACEKLTTFIRQTGTNFLQGIRKNTLCHWFGQTARFDQIFNQYDKWYYRTDPRSGKKVFFQEKTLNLVKHGRCKVFAVRRGDEARIRYFATNVLKLTINRLLKRLKVHWRVETMHLDLKERFHFNGCNSGKDVLNLIHWQLCYLVYFLSCQYQHLLHRNGERISLTRLLFHYQYQYDEERAHRCFSSPSRRLKLQQLLVTS